MLNIYTQLKFQKKDQNIHLWFNSNFSTDSLLIFIDSDRFWPNCFIDWTQTKIWTGSWFNQSDWLVWSDSKTTDAHMLPIGFVLIRHGNLLKILQVDVDRQWDPPHFQSICHISTYMACVHQIIKKKKKCNQNLSSGDALQ